MAQLSVTAINRRAFRDFFYGWYDVINTGLFIALVSAVLAYVGLLFLNDSAIVGSFFDLSDSDRFNGVLVLFSVFISGGTAAGIWLYQEIIERWASAQTVKSVAQSILATLPQGPQPADKTVSLPQEILPGMESFVSDNLKAVSMLAPANRLHFVSLITCLSHFNRLLPEPSGRQVNADARRDLVDQILCHALIVARQLERGRPDRYNDIALGLSGHADMLSAYYRFDSG